MRWEGSEGRTVSDRDEADSAGSASVAVAERAVKRVGVSTIEEVGGRSGRREEKGRNDKGRKTHLTIFCIESEVNLFSSYGIAEGVSTAVEGVEQRRRTSRQMYLVGFAVPFKPA